MSSSSASSQAGQFGPNEWLVEEMYQRFLDDPSAVDPASVGLGAWGALAGFDGGSCAVFCAAFRAVTRVVSCCAAAPAPLAAALGRAARDVVPAAGFSGALAAAAAGARPFVALRPFVAVPT